MQKLNDAKEKLTSAWNENPLAVIAVATAATIAVVKVIDATTAARNSRTWAKEVNRRTASRH